MEWARFERPDLEWLRPIYQAVVARQACPSPSHHEAWNSAPSDEDWKQRYKRSPTMPPPANLNDLAEAVFSTPLRFALLASDLHARGRSVHHALRVAYNCYQQFLFPSRQESWALYQDVLTHLQARESHRLCCLQQLDNDMYLHAEQLPHGWAVFEPGFERYWYAMCLHESGVYSGTEEGRLYQTLSQIVSDEHQRQLRCDMAVRPTVVEHAAGSFSYASNPRPCSAELALRGGDVTHAWNRLLRYRLDGVHIPSTRDAFLRGESLEREYFGVVVGEGGFDVPASDDVIQQANIEVAATQAEHADGELPAPAAEEEIVLVPTVEELEHRVSALREELDEDIHTQEHVVALRAWLEDAADGTARVAEQLAELNAALEDDARHPERVMQVLQACRAECCRLAGRVGSLREIEERERRAGGDGGELVEHLEGVEPGPPAEENGEAGFWAWLTSEGGVAEIWDGDNL
ncbi:hypothetical protein BU16DRAFT_211577 [Lophium mytilinum]|uniref:Uncharacterized protein n=1 Tax=Lophium mytilinum TaxID=390894 RepID=A0A6A6RDT6_9PEZI|nr:hypothetical protein BU16DRAFT_211577 [Lophium mytilinum]